MRSPLLRHLVAFPVINCYSITDLVYTTQYYLQDPVKGLQYTTIGTIVCDFGKITRGMGVLLSEEELTLKSWSCFQNLKIFPEM